MLKATGRYDATEALLAARNNSKLCTGITKTQLDVVGGASYAEQELQSETHIWSFRTCIMQVSDTATPHTAQTTPEGSSAKELTLRLVGMATTSVPNGERDTFGRDKLSKDSDEFLSYDCLLYTSPSPRD